MFIFFCSFLALVGKKRTKEAPLKGEGRGKIRKNNWQFKLIALSEFFAIPYPLRIPLPLLVSFNFMGWVLKREY